MRRTEMLQEIRKMRFEEVYGGWSESRLTQEEAARILGVCDRTFRRYIDRYEQGGMEGLSDRKTTGSGLKCGRARSRNLAGANPAPEGWPSTGQQVLGGCVATYNFKRRTASRQAVSRKVEGNEPRN